MGTRHTGRHIKRVALLTVLFALMSCKGSDGPTAPAGLPTEYADSWIATAILGTLRDIYNQNVAGRPSGPVNLSASCPNGGSVAQTGTVTTPVGGGITTINLTSTLSNCYAIRSYAGPDGETHVTSTHLTGSITETGSFSSTHDSRNFQSTSLTVSGTLKIVGYPEATINETCAFTANKGLSAVNGTFCSRTFSY